MSDDPNLVDYLTLAAATLGTLGGIFTTIWATRRSDRERFDLLVDWTWEPAAPDPEWPVLHVHNKGESAILISEVRLATGVVKRKATFGTAIYWEDPADLPFPVSVEPGTIRRFRLDETLAKKQYGKLRSFQKAFGRIRRSALWVEVLTAGGSLRRTGGEKALAWKDRPRWTKIEDEYDA